MAGTFTRRDHETSRQIHRLFWRANLTDWPALLGWALCRPTAILIYNALIPIQIAYGLQAIFTRHFDAVGQYAWNAFLLAIVYCVLWGVGGIAICRNGRAGTVYLQREIFVNYLQKDYEFYSNTYLGALGMQATKLRDAFNDYCQWAMNGVTKQVVIVVSSIAIIAYHSLLLAGATLISMLFVLSFTIGSSKWRLKYRRELSEAASDTAGVIGDALGHGLTVKSFAAENYEISRLDISLNRLASTQYWSWMASIPADMGHMILAAGATSILLILTARLYENHTISIAIVALVQLYVIKLVGSTQDIADLVKIYETTMSSAHQAVKTMLIAPTVKDKATTVAFPKQTALNIKFDHVHYSYNDSQSGSFAIKNFALQITPGEKVGLVGYSGSGKTTLTKLLLRFMDIQSGAVTIGGVDLRDLAQTDLRKAIAYVPQEPLLFHRSIADNIAYGNPQASKRSVIAAAKAAYVDEFVKDLPHGYDTLVGERGIKLSGGQRQRVAIARAILKDAPILVLDEATSALDSRSEKFIQKALWHLMKGRTALVIAHRLSTVQHMDRIIVMHKGSIKQTGTHEELLSSGKSIYAKLWEHQSGGYIGRPVAQENGEV